MDIAGELPDRSGAVTAATAAWRSIASRKAENSPKSSGPSGPHVADSTRPVPSSTAKLEHSLLECHESERMLLGRDGSDPASSRGAEASHIAAAILSRFPMSSLSASTIWASSRRDWHSACSSVSDRSLMAVYDEKARRGRTASKISTRSLNRRLPAICLIRLPVAIVFPLNEEIRKCWLLAQSFPSVPRDGHFRRESRYSAPNTNHTRFD